VLVDQGTIDAFRADGHVAVRGLATAEELDAVRPAILERGVADAWDTRPLDERDTYGKAFLQSFNLWRLDPAIEAFVRSPRYAEVAARLLGCDGVRLYHDQALFKEAGGGPTPWHQDQCYWPMDTDLTVTMWMPLVDVPAEVGTMSFASGSHRLGDLRGPVISDESDAAFAAAIEEHGLPVTTHGPLAAGDATFHAGWTVHSAPPNPTAELRPVMTVIYVADGARVARDLTKVQRFDCKVWLGGRREGELIDHELNPLLWPA
jgi:ectoine hydroxylase-related dioxygenase (phytanoyl-CoA dioxygenase family)